MTWLARDLHYAARAFSRTPFFSTTATVVLAIAISVAAAVFSLYSHLHLQPVPGVQSSDRLVSIGLARQESEWIPLTIDQYRQLEALLVTPEGIFGAGASTSREVEYRGNLVPARTVGVTEGFLTRLGVPMLAGVDLDTASPDPLAMNAVISERFWRSRLAADPNAVGSTLLVDGSEYRVVGIVGGGFDGLRRDAYEEIWVPIESVLATRTGPAGMPEAAWRVLSYRIPVILMYARLPAGTPRSVLQQEVDAALPRLREEWQSPLQADITRLVVLPGSSISPRSHAALVRQSMLLVGGAVLMLLVASMNLASYFLARGVGRIQELRTRLAIGASRAAIIRQLFTESAFIVALASLLGIILHFWLKSLLFRAMIAGGSWNESSDWRVFLFLIIAAVLAACIAGLLPAASISLNPRLSIASPTSIGQRSSALQPLIALQVLVATLVVLAGTLFIDDLRRLERADSGFSPDSMMVAPLGYDRSRARSLSAMGPGQGVMFMQEMENRLSAIPGLDVYAFAAWSPFQGRDLNPGVVEVVGLAEPLPDERREVFINLVTPDFFRVLQVPILHGRMFSDNDSQAVVVSRSMAVQIWGRDNVVGERFYPPEHSRVRRAAEMMPPLTVVGVVGDFRYASGRAAPPIWYRSLAETFVGGDLMVRGNISPEVLHPIADEIVREVMPGRQLEPLMPMGRIIHQSLGPERLRSRVAGATALMALALTMIGLYAAMQHTVEAQRSELAVRKAVGASERHVVTMVFRRALSVVGIGAASAALVSILFQSQFSQLLFGLDTTDVRAWIMALLVVFSTSVLAAWLPARRAGRIDPSVALRYE